MHYYTRSIQNVNPFFKIFLNFFAMSIQVVLSCPKRLFVQTKRPISRIFRNLYPHLPSCRKCRSAAFSSFPRRKKALRVYAPQRLFYAEYSLMHTKNQTLLLFSLVLYQRVSSFAMGAHQNLRNMA